MISVQITMAERPPPMAASLPRPSRPCDARNTSSAPQTVDDRSTAVRAACARLLIDIMQALPSLIATARPIRSLSSGQITIDKT